MYAELVDRLLEKRPSYEHGSLGGTCPDRLLDGCFALLFPHHSGPAQRTRSGLLAEARRVEADLLELLGALGLTETRAEGVIRAFMDSLPELAGCLYKDAAFILDGDPAASSVDEVILTYPGFYAIAAHRLAHLLYTYRLPILPRLLSERAHARTGIDIHPGARIGCPFYIDHGTGLVIGETARIGARVKIYQGVTLGALAVVKEQANQRRHPTIRDDVVIYANATVLGGDTVIGKGTVIGGNAWVTESVPPHSMVYHKAEVHVRTELTAAWSHTRKDRKALPPRAQSSQGEPPAKV